jgi:hypothetical protein
MLNSPKSNHSLNDPSKRVLRCGQPSADLVPVLRGGVLPALQRSADGHYASRGALQAGLGCFNCGGGRGIAEGTPYQ